MCAVSRDHPLAEGGPPRVIRSKISVPPVAEDLVARPRVTDLLARLVPSRRVVFVCATAGAGKTSAVVDAAGRLGRPVCWLTVDDTDVAPGRLLTYLEATLARHVPATEGVATAALQARIPHAEAAGLLAESTEGRPVLLVVDGAERLAGAPEALAVLGAVARYAPPTLRVVVISRTELGIDLGSAGGVGQVAEVGERELSLTPAEAAEILARAGHAGIDPARAVEATGGWLTGVLFEAWRSSEHVAGTGGEADPLHGYLATQILSRLKPAERDFLVATSLLDEVTAARAEALGQPAAGGRLVALRAKHLPVTWLPGGGGMRCHPRFREYLVARLERLGRDEVVPLRRAYGDLLVAEGHFEEAVEQFLATGDLDRALSAVERAIRAVVERLDDAVAERWLDAVRPVAPRGASALTTAELMLAIAQEDYRRGGRVADRLLAEGERESLARASSTAASMMAWCYWHLGRLEDAAAVVAVADASPEIEATQYLLSLVRAEPAGGRPQVPEPSGGPLDALIMRVHYAHGRLRQLAEPPASSWAAAVTGAWRVGALRAMGHLEEALALYRAGEGVTAAPAWMYGVVGPELMISLGDVEEARATVARGRGLIPSTGSVVFDMLNRLFEAKLELRLCRNPDAALDVLAALESGPHGRRYEFIAEQIDTWSAMALMLKAPDEAPVERLERAVASMVAADRILELPTAAVLLAEAHWRAGDEDAADRAADRALGAAERQGSNHILLEALGDFPSVVSRRLDAETSPDSAWHALGRALMAKGIAAEVQAQTVVSVTEFGRAALVVEGAEVRPRIAKSVELAAYLASVPGQAAQRDELLGALFDGRADDSSRAYLRQAVHRLREVLPEEAGLRFAGSRLAFDGRIVLVAESAEVQALLARTHLRGEERLKTIVRALQIADRGEYLPGVDAAWAAERRAELAQLAADGRLEAAQLAFALGRYPEAGELVEAVLAEDRYKESAWRLLMRIDNAIGDEDRVIAAYRECRQALQELGAEPSDATRRLLGQLRR